MAIKNEDGTAVVSEKPAPLSWYPDRMAWHMEISRREMKKNPLLSDFHKWITRETEAGHISRQEAVSMIPVFFMDIEPHHKVLDMCAAPGMKTTQLLENLTIGDEEPTGVVVANDADRNRAFLLAHTLKRIKSPAFMVVHHDARHVPTLKSDDGTNKVITFDRILCDVPCSGDGTLRKAPDAWEKWTPAGGLNLHKTQVGIAMRAASLLTVGGCMVYSTCSFNPVENEASVAELMRLTNGALEIMDMSDRLPELKRAQGFHSWKIMGRDKKIYDKFEDCAEPKEASLQPSMFPPSKEAAKAMHLERCMRLIPSHQNTGGFFIVILRKNKAFSMDPTKVLMAQSANPTKLTSVDMADKEEAEPVAPAEPVEKSDELCQIWKKHGKCKYESKCKYTHCAVEDAGMKMKSSVEGEEPMSQINVTHPQVVAKLVEAFGFAPERGFKPEQLFSRSQSDTKMPKNISYVSESICEIISCDQRQRLAVINCGMKAFERVELKDPAVVAPYKIVQEMTELFLPKMGKRTIETDIKTFQKMIYKNMHEFTALEALDSGFKAQIEKMATGTVVVFAKHGGKTFTASAFKGREKLQLYFPKDDVEVCKSELVEKIGEPVWGAEDTAAGEAKPAVVEAAVAAKVEVPKEASHVKF